jgi:hypothetical protein
MEQLRPALLQLEELMQATKASQSSASAFEP